jgi:hypothetical protein
MNGLGRKSFRKIRRQGNAPRGVFVGRTNGRFFLRTPEPPAYDKRAS